MSAQIEEDLRKSQRRFELPAHTVELLLVRHGSALRADSLHPRLGHSDPPLSASGREQAARLAKRFQRQPPASVFSSPLRRARETAEIAAAGLGLEINTNDELCEVHLGEWELDFEARAEAKHPLAMQILAEGRWELAPGAESSEAFCARVERGLTAIARRSASGSSVAVVAHAGVIAEACHIATDSRPFGFLSSENTAVTRLLVPPEGQWRLRSYNDTAHLDD